MIGIKLDSKTARLRLPVRKKPYTARLAQGIRLAYRRNEGPGTWSVLGGGGAWLKKIGIADDLDPADGVHVLDYWQATGRAQETARVRDGDSGAPLTVAAALDDYEKDLKARGGHLANVRRVRSHLPPTLDKKPISLLTARELRAWRDGMVEKGLKPASADRCARALKAALNLAAKDDTRISNTAAWRGLNRLPDAEESNNIVLPDAVIRALVAAAYEADPAFGLYVEAHAVTGARTSQLLRLQVRDLEDNGGGPRLMMPSSRKGRRRRTERRPVPVSSDFAATLRRACIGRPADAPILGSHHHRRFSQLTRGLGLDRRVTLYALRHSSITRMLVAGVPVRIVAAHHDTSVAMLEKTYSRHIADHADELVRGTLLQMNPPAGGNVVPMVRG
jgi:integrase